MINGWTRIRTDKICVNLAVNLGISVYLARGEVKRGRSFLILFFVLIFFLFYVWQKIEVVRMGYKRERKKEELDSLFKVNSELKIRLSDYKNLKIIEKIAQENLGMIFPKKENIIYLEEQ